MSTALKKSKAVEKSIETIDSDFIKALAEPARIEILKQLILVGPCDVKTLSLHMPQDRSVISRHLSLMAKAGILSMSKQGRHVIYSVDGEGALKKSEELVETMRQCMVLCCYIRGF